MHFSKFGVNHLKILDSPPKLHFFFQTEEFETFIIGSVGGIIYVWEKRFEKESHIFCQFLN